MHADDPWPRPENREMNPLWIAALILAVLFIGYQVVVRDLPRKPQAAAARTPAPATNAPPAVAPDVQHMPPPAAQRVPPAPVARVAEPAPATREIYLCKGYSGGMFWSSAICSTQRATIDRIVAVPTSLSWDEQVQLAEGRWREAQSLYRPQPSEGGIVSLSGRPSGAGECAALEARIQQLDAMARQPQSGFTQDWIRSERRAARDRQTALRC